MYNSNGHESLDKARKAAQRTANQTRKMVRIVHDTDQNTFRTTTLDFAWPQYTTVESVEAK